MAGGVSGRGHTWQGACMAEGACVAGECMAGETATAVDGMHPTGMHSCYCSFQVLFYMLKLLKF